MSKEVKETSTEQKDIIQIIRDGAVIPEDAVKAAAAKIAKDKSDTAIKEATECLQKSEFIRLMTLLIVRKKRESSNISLEKLKSVSTLDDDLKAGKLTPREYEEKIDEIEKTTRNKLRDLDNNHDKHAIDLRGQFSRDYCVWAWENAYINK